MESFLRLDIRDWRRAGLLKRGTAHRLLLQFVNQVGWAAGTVALVIVTPEQGDAFVIVGLTSTGKLGGQRIELTSAACRFGGERFYFICPFRRKRCEVLVCVLGVFASRQAHRLNYRSQCEGRYDHLVSVRLNLLESLSRSDRNRIRGFRRARLEAKLEDTERQLLASTVARFGLPPSLS